MWNIYSKFLSAAAHDVMPSNFYICQPAVLIFRSTSLRELKIFFSEHFAPFLIEYENLQVWPSAMVIPFSALVKYERFDTRFERESDCQAAVMVLYTSKQKQKLLTNRNVELIVNPTSP